MLIHTLGAGLLIVVRVAVGHSDDAIQTSPGYGEENIDLSDATWVRLLAKDINNDETLPWSADQALGGPVHPRKLRRLRRSLSSEVVDWRKSGYLRPVENQAFPKQCGSCWAFGSIHAANDNLNIRNKRRGADLASKYPSEMLSVQDLLECNCEFTLTYHRDDNDRCRRPTRSGRRTPGCSGGFSHMALQYLSQTSGLEGHDPGTTSVSCKPYLAEDYPCKKTCASSFPHPYQKNLTIPGYRRLAATKSAILSALKTGPVVVTMKVYSDINMLKSNGIYVPSKSRMNRFLGWHTVEIVGHGTSTVFGEYWIAKNSWGPAWPTETEEGFFKIRVGEVEIEKYAFAVDFGPSQNAVNKLSSVPASCAPQPLTESHVENDAAAESALQFLHSEVVNLLLGSCYPKSFGSALISATVDELHGTAIKFTFQVNYTSPSCPGTWREYEGVVITNMTTAKHVLSFSSARSGIVSESKGGCNCTVDTRVSAQASLQPAHISLIGLLTSVAAFALVFMPLQ